MAHFGAAPIFLFEIDGVRARARSSARNSKPVLQGQRAAPFERPRRRYYVVPTAECAAELWTRLQARIDSARYFANSSSQLMKQGARSQ